MLRQAASPGPHIQRNNPRQHRAPTRRSGGDVQGDARLPHEGCKEKSGGYAGYAATAGSRMAQSASLSGTTSLDDAAAPYADMERYRQHGRKKASAASIVVAVVLLALIGVGVYLYLDPPTYNVTVNGMSRTVNKGTTLGEIISEGIVSPKAGNLVAVDGEVLEEGAGAPFAGLVNGAETSDPALELHKGDSVQIGDGGDVSEGYSAETTTSEPGHVEIGAGAVHVYIPGEPGEVETRVGEVSGKTVSTTVREPSDSVYLKYNPDPGDDKVVALTFDDGPWSTTNELLDVLKENDAKATFFTIGEQIFDEDNYADVVKRAASEGHEIATHSYDHAASGGGNRVDMTRQSTDKQIEEVQQGQQAIADAIGQEPSKLFRSPGGNFYGDVIWTLQPYITAEIGWNIDSEDWKQPGVDAIVQKILAVSPGDVILLHDGGGDRSQTIEALKIALPQLKAEGYRFVTIDQLLGYNDPKALAQKLLQQDS